MVQSQSRKIVHKTYLENTQHKKGLGGLDQVVDHMPIKCEALSSNSSTIKKQNKELKEMSQKFKI
jgi:hypothetical protein